ALRRIFAGDKVSMDGRAVRVRGFRRQADPIPDIPIHLGALGPRMCRLAGAVADGVQFALMSPEGASRALWDVREGIRSAGRDGTGFDVVLRVPIAVDEPRDIVREVARMLLTGYAI